MRSTDSKTYNFVYKTTNLVNGKIYIGVHKTDKLEDGYLGSGVNIRRAIKKYKPENFSREILKMFSTYEEALQYEAELVTKEFIEESTNYNIKTGGLQNINHSFKSRERLSQSMSILWMTDEHRSKMLAVFNSDERKEKIGRNVKKWIRENPELHMQRMDKINKNPEKIRKMVQKQTGRPQTEERKKNIALALKGKYLGEKNPNFGGWWHTPFGKFDSLRAASEITGNSVICIRDRCLAKNNNVVLKFSTFFDKKISEDMIGKTWRELGWFYEAIV